MLLGFFGARWERYFQINVGGKGVLAYLNSTFFDKSAERLDIGVI